MAFFFMAFFSTQASEKIDSLELYTPYTKVSVSPGNPVNYSIKVINNGTNTRNENITLTDMPRSWNYSLTAGAYNIKKLSVLPAEKQTLSLKVEVPNKVRKGNYTFYVKAGNNVILPLTIRVASAGSNVTEFTCGQKNMEGTPKSSFNFNAVLKNKTVSTQQYALMARAPRGWRVLIKPGHKQATSTEVEPNKTKNITYEVKPSPSVKAGSYKIPVKVVSGTTSAALELEVVITGTYEMTLTTPSGLLSDHVTAGANKKVEFEIKNTGSADLDNVELKASKPKKWNVSFDHKKIEKIAPGKTETVYATILADKKAIPGDYVTQIEAKTPDVKSSVSFRISVRTPVTVGLIGIVIIILVLLGIIALFRKYGRR